MQNAEVFQNHIAPVAPSQTQAEVIDMTPIQDTSLVSRLTSAVDSGAAIESGATWKPLPKPSNRILSMPERVALTSSNTDKLVEHITFTSERLQGAMHRIGYLESLVESLEAQVAVLPELRARTARAILIEKENKELKSVIEHRNQQIIKREHLIDKRDEQISILEKLLAAYKRHLTMVEVDLAKLENSSWVRFCAWFTGTPLKP